MIYRYATNAFTHYLTQPQTPNIPSCDVFLEMVLQLVLKIRSIAALEAGIERIPRTRQRKIYGNFCLIAAHAQNLTISKQPSWQKSLKSDSFTSLN